MTIRHRFGFPSILFIGVHREAEKPLRYLLDAGEAVVGLVTLDESSRMAVSGSADLGPYPASVGLPVLFVGNVNESRCVDWARALAPDVLLVVGWTQLLKAEMLSVPKIACLGFHASLLPKYRGRAPINWALINGEIETGNTMIVLEPGADEGDIVAQRRIPITDEDDCATLYDKVAATEVEMLAEVLPALRAGHLPRRQQDSSQATVMPRRRPEDGRIDWARSTAQLHNWVRALTHPYPGAFTESDGRRVWIWRARPATDPGTASSAPGLLRIQGGRPYVATRDGWLEILAVQAEGEEELTGTEAAATFLTPGHRLGDAPAGVQ